MPDQLSFFRAPSGTVAVALPHKPESVITDWTRLRSRMVREMPPAFTRDEWAYLISFLDSGNLKQPFISTFGDPLDSPDGPVSVLARPRGEIALWLPNNVSLLGPLTLVLLSLTGQPVHIKAGSSSENLTAELLNFALEHLPEGGLRRHLNEQVRCDVFDRTDPRNAEMAARAQVRIVFGADAAAESIQKLPHPLESVGFSFVDRRSEAWVQEPMLTDTVLSNLLRVFAIYGQAGCTSPKRVVLLDGNDVSAMRLRDRLIDLWPKTFTRDPPMHIASGNLMARQWAATLGWSAETTVRNGAVIACGDLALEECDAPMLLSIVPATVEQAEAALPENIQTVGHALEDPGSERWRLILSRTRIKRFIPLGRMHHFGTLWDGWEFWRQLFEAVEIQT